MFQDITNYKNEEKTDMSRLTKFGYPWEVHYKPPSGSPGVLKK
jgi:hypothetical protein